MLHTIIMRVCLTNAPRPCEIHEESVGDLAIHPAVAFMQAQLLVAQWMQAHPG